MIAEYARRRLQFSPVSPFLSFSPLSVFLPPLACNPLSLYLLFILYFIFVFFLSCSFLSLCLSSIFLSILSLCQFAVSLSNSSYCNSRSRLRLLNKSRRCVTVVNMLVCLYSVCLSVCLFFETLFAFFNSSVSC
jgi:hypothetical protein